VKTVQIQVQKNKDKVRILRVYDVEKKRFHSDLVPMLKTFVESSPNIDEEAKRQINQKLRSYFKTKDFIRLDITDTIDRETGEIEEII